MPKFSSPLQKAFIEGKTQGLLMMARIATTTPQSHARQVADTMSSLISYCAWNELENDMERLAGFAAAVTPFIRTGLKQRIIYAASHDQIPQELADHLIQEGLHDA